MSHVIPFGEQRVFVESEDERELLRIFRVLRQPDEVLLWAHHQLSQQQQPLEVWMSIERLHQGRQRTFWTNTNFRFQQDKASRLRTLEDVRTTAEDFLDAFFAERRIEDDSPTEFVSEFRDQLSSRADTFVRRGRYRVEVYGLPAEMVDAWAPTQIGGAR